MNKTYDNMTKNELIMEIKQRDKRLSELVDEITLTLHFTLEHPIMEDPYKILHGYLDSLRDPPWDSYYSE